MDVFGNKEIEELQKTIEELRETILSQKNSIKHLEVDKRQRRLELSKLNDTNLSIISANEEDLNHLKSLTAGATLALKEEIKQLENQLLVKSETYLRQIAGLWYLSGRFQNRKEDEEDEDDWQKGKWQQGILKLSAISIVASYDRTGLEVDGMRFQMHNGCDVSLSQYIEALEQAHESQDDQQYSLSD